MLAGKPDAGNLHVRFDEGEQRDWRQPPVALYSTGQEILPEAPTKGLALCKNPHWAMDRSLIAPCTDHHWKVSSISIPGRSDGEKELLEPAGKSLLLPKDEAFHPDAGGLRWRYERLIA